MRASTGDAGLLPQQVAHAASRPSRGMPGEFVEAERQVEVLQRLRRRALEQVVERGDDDQAAAVVRQREAADCDARARPAMRLTHGASSTTRTSGSPA